uniref:Uncharacterized protein n=1 Tax=Rhizophora mucronata TaxID=61149 RepID=A0A2P2Q801_RHIMU
MYYLTFKSVYSLFLFIFDIPSLL